MTTFRLTGPHTRHGVPPLDTSDPLALIETLANADADVDDCDDMPFFGRAADGSIWAVGRDVAYRWEPVR